MILSINARIVSSCSGVVVVPADSIWIPIITTAGRENWYAGRNRIFNELPIPTYYDEVEFWLRDIPDV